MNTIENNSQFSDQDDTLIHFVDEMIIKAFNKNISDIHIEPYKRNFRIRYRQQGLLQEVCKLPFIAGQRIMTRLKVLGKLDISEQRIPQDGYFQLNNIDIRISTCPLLSHQKIVLRLSNPTSINLAINQLGFTSFQQELFLKKIRQPQGMILVTGPTGSGKTVTLYSALSYLNNIENNIVTIEDPVEIELAGINQININSKTNLNIHNILRFLLRQDPDIIMIGEIRDAETANMALEAAQTGHLVLATLHTNSAIDCFARLHALNISNYHLAYSISLIIAQRLLRKLCSHCKIPIKTCDGIFYKASQCQHCIQGYAGRTAIYELLPLTESISQLINNNASASEIKDTLLAQRFFSLQDSALLLAKKGITSLEEINRVLVT